MAEPCAVHRPNTAGVQCVDCGATLGQVFYADPVDADGNVIGTARLTVTHSTYPITATKVPHAELALEDTPTIRAAVPYPENDSPHPGNDSPPEQR